MTAPLAQQLADGEAPVYLLHGDEAFLTRRAMAWLRQRVLGGIAEDFNLDRFDGGEKADPERIIGAARTLPMMAARRLVWVRNADAFFGAKVKPEALRDYVKTPDPSSCVVFQANKSVRKDGILYRAIKKHGCIFESTTPYERELVGWVRSQAREKGRSLRPDAAALLVEVVGRDLATLDDNLDRLALFVPGDAEIDASHVEKCVPHSRTRTVWELVDAVADRNLGAALARAHTLMGQGENALGLLAMIARQVRQLIIGRSARAGGASPQEAAAAAGVPGFRVGSFTRQLDNYRGRELIEALARLADADRALKSSKLPDELILEGVLMDLCARSGGASRPAR